jgi:hypothetical protein
MLATALSCLVIAYLPGALAFRIPVGAPHLRAAFPAEERVFWAVVLSVCWSLTVVLVFAGLGVYTLDRLLVTNGALSALILAAWRTRLRFATPAARPTWSALVPVGLVALGSVLYLPSSEYVIGGKDPGTYVNEGVQIAQTGSVMIDDEVVSSVPPALRDLFFPWHKSRYYYGLRFMGFYVRDPATGEVIGQFPHLLPAAVAVGYGLNGLSGARDTVVAWAVCGLVAVYLVGARLIGPVAAASAAVLLAVNVVQVWFARYPNSEIVMQALLFAAILAFARAAEGSRTFFGPVAGGLLGLMMFLRYDVVLAVAAFAASAAVLPVSGRRVGAWFAAVLVATSTIGLWYLANPMIAYAAYPLGFTRDQGGWWLVALAIAAMVAFRAMIRRTAAARAVRRGLPSALSASLVLLAAYAYFVRSEGGRTAIHDAMAFRTFGWYLTPVGLAAAVVGAGWLTWTRFWRLPPFFLTLASFSVFFFYKTRIVPEHFWAARRFVAMILPGALIAIAGLAAAIARAHPPHEPGTTASSRAPARRARLRAITAPLVTVSLLVPIGVTFWRSSAPVRAHVEYAGLIPHLERVAESIGSDDLLLVEARNAGSDLHVLALPLAYVYAKHVLVLDSAVPAKRSLENLVAWAHTRYTRVLFLGGGGTDLLTRRLAATRITSGQFRVPEYDARINAYPSGPRRKDFEFGLYQLAIDEPQPRGPIDARIGVDDDLKVVRFHARERRGTDGLPFRWSGPQSFVLLLGIGADARRITIWMDNGGRPPNAAPAAAEVAVDNVAIGTATVAGGLRAYTFSLPADLAARAAASDDPVRLRLRVPPWVPSVALGGTDTRELGVIVTRVEVQ